MDRPAWGITPLGDCSRQEAASRADAVQYTPGVYRGTQSNVYQVRTGHKQSRRGQSPAALYELPDFCGRYCWEMLSVYSVSGPNWR